MIVTGAGLAPDELADNNHRVGGKPPTLHEAEVLLRRCNPASEQLFEDEAEKLLVEEAELAAKFGAWKLENPVLLTNQEAVLDFIFANCAKYREPEWQRYPVFMIER